MNKFNFSVLIFLGLIAQVNSASACDCMNSSKGEGFYAEMDTQFLPQNAKGVLFFVKPEDSVLPIVYRNLQPAQFSFRDSQNPRELPIKIKKLEMQKVRGDFQKYNIYRLEPIDGFKAGHEYIFKVKETPAWDPSPYRYVLKVKIDNVVIGRSDLMKTAFAANDDAIVEFLEVAGGASCSNKIEAKVQNVNFQLPPRLGPYRESLRYFVHYQTGSQKKAWSYKKFLCSTSNFGRSGVELGQDKLFIPTTKISDDTLLTRGPKYQITGSWVFPEVDATVYESRPFSFSYER